MKKLNQDLLMLRVWLHEKPIGTITQLAGDRHWFAFDETYLNQHNRPTLSLSFK